MTPLLLMVLLEFRVTAAPWTATSTPPPGWMTISPGLLFAAFAVATGVLVIEVMERSSASAWVEIPASNRHTNGLRVTKSSSWRTNFRKFCRGETAMANLQRQALNRRSTYYIML